jgi:hypothetical protein
MKKSEFKEQQGSYINIIKLAFFLEVKTKNTQELNLIIGVSQR